MKGGDRMDKQQELEDVKANALLIKQLLIDENLDAFREHFFMLHPYDQAQFYEKVGPDIRQTMYSYLSPQEMAIIFREIDLEDEEYSEFLKEMDASYVAAMLSDMYTDDAVDVLNELESADREHYLEMMDDETVEEINELLAYEQYTAGAIMTTEYVSILAKSTVRSAMEVMRREAPTAETIYYIFVIDDAHKLVGVVSLRDLIIAKEETIIEEIMSDRVVSILVFDDQEVAAKIMRDYNFLALPVVNKDNELQGIITVDDIIDVIDEEASDDYSKLAGISEMDDIDAGPLKSAKSRLPWLIVLLFLGMLTANLMSRFEATLEQVAILSIFIPLIAGTSGNSGTQALAVAVRGIATGEVGEQSKVKLLFRELLTGLLMGTVCAAITVGIVYFWKGELVIGLLVGAAICGSILMATLAGSFIPLLMHRLGIDPAVASGPFITTLNDVTSLMIYLGLATAFLSQIM